MHLAAYLKHGPYTWPGGYQMNAVMDDSEFLCYDCCKNEPTVHEGGEADGWRFEDADIYWEGPDLNCAHCGKIIVSEYGDPEEEKL